MLTRKGRRKVQWHQRCCRILKAKLKIHKFYSPYKVYKISDNFYFQEVDRQPIVNVNLIFAYNRIVEARSHDNVITMKLVPTDPGFETPIEYVVQRFKSFGDKASYDFAAKLEQFVALGNDYTPEEVNTFADPLDFLVGGEKSTWFAIKGCYTNPFLRFSSIEVSHNLCRALGFTIDQMMAASVTTGSLPIKSNRPDAQYYMDKCIMLLTLLLRFRQLAKSNNSLGLKQLAAMTRSRNQVSYVTSSNVSPMLSQLTGKAVFYLTSISPTDMLFQFEQIKSQFMLQKQWMNHEDELDLDEAEVLRTIMGMTPEQRNRMRGRTSRFKPRPAEQ